MPTDRRAKMMMIAIAVTVAMAIGLYALVQFDESLTTREQQLAQLRQSVGAQDRKLSKGRKAAAKLKRWRARSLPSGPSGVELARSLYLNWLRDAVQSSGLSDVDLKSTSRSVGRQSRKANYRALSYTLSARGDMEQLTQFLYSFYRRDHLHKIHTMSITPDEKAAGFRFNFTISALVLPGADRDDRLSDAVSGRLAHDSVEQYQKVIAQRNLFGPFNHPPELSSISDKTAYQESRLSFTVRASDDDEGQKRSFSLGDDAPSGARISSSGSFTWTADKSTELTTYEFTVIVRDNGLPAKEDTATVRVTVEPPRPKLPSPPYKSSNPTFAEGRLTKIIAVTQSRGRRQVWLWIQTTDETLILEAGDEFTVGKLEAKIVGIYNTHFEVDAYGQRFRVPYSGFLSAAKPLPGKNDAAGE